MGQANPAFRHDPRCLAEARVWLAAAAGELHTARALSTRADVRVEAVLHAARRTAENSLRAFLCAHSVRATPDQDLRSMGERSLGLDPSLHPAVAHAETLAGNGSGEGFEGAVRIASLVYESVRLRLTEGLAS